MKYSLTSRPNDSFSHSMMLLQSKAYKPNLIIFILGKKVLSAYLVCIDLKPKSVCKTA